MTRRPAAALLTGTLLCGLTLGGTALAPAAADQTTPPDPTDRIQQQDRPQRLLERGDLAPAHRGITPPNAQHQRKAVERQLAQATEQLVADGAVGVIARVDSPTVSWRGSAGTRRVDGRAPAQPQDRFRIGSVTKTMVAVLVLQEVEAGSFELSTPVEQILPGLLPGHPDVTVEHLLSHRSGLQTGTAELISTRMTDPTDWGQFLAAISQDYTAQEHLDVATALPWMFEPGTDFLYSNAGYVALGMLLEETTGTDLDQLLEERILRPAKMRHTDFPDDPGRHGPFLTGAMWTGTQEQDGLDWVSLDRFDPEVFDAAGAAVSTTQDLNRFAQALFTGRLLDPALVERMAEPLTEPGGYGLGIYRIPDPCTTAGEAPEWLYGHDGLTFGTVTVLLSSPDGSRQVSLGATGRDLTSLQPTTYDVNELLAPMALATCAP